MSWTEPTQRSTGDLITQAIYNADIIDNLAYLRQVAEPDLTNKSGGSLEAGDVVIWDASNDQAVTTTTTAGSTKVAGVVMATVANDADGRVALLGVVTVKVQGNVTRGNFLRTSTTAKRAEDAGTVKASGTFAVALTAYSGGAAGSVIALLMPSTIGGEFPANGVAYTTDSSAPSGWTEYTSARGRVIVGLPSGGTMAGTVGTALSNLGEPTHTHTYTGVPYHRHAISIYLPVGDNGASNIQRTKTNTGTPSTAYSEYEGSASPSTAAGNHAMPYIQLLGIKKS